MQCFPSCGAPTCPPRGTCTTSYKVILLGSIVPTKAKAPWPAGPTTMLTKWNTTPKLHWVRPNLMGPAPGCSHLRPLCFQDLGRGQVLPGLGLCLGVATLKKCPQAGPLVTLSCRWGQPLTSGPAERGGNLWGSPGFQTEMLESSSLGWWWKVGEGCWDWAYKNTAPSPASSPSGPKWTDSSVPTGRVCQRKLWRRQHHSEPLGFSKHNVQHATKEAKKGVTTNRTKRKRAEPDPEVSDVYQHIRSVLEVSDANVTCSKIYLTKGKISENQNRLSNFTITVTEFKNSVSGLNTKLDVAEERISELKDWSSKKYI